MKKILFLFYLLAIQTLIAQPMPEPIKSQYRQAKTSQQKAELLLDVVRPSMADSLDLVQKIVLRNWFKKNGDELGANYCQLYLAATIMFKGDNSSSLKMLFPILEDFERENDSYAMMRCHHIIGMTYSIGNSERSFGYLKKAIATAEKYHYEKFLTIAYNDFGVALSEGNQPELGLVYAQKAVNLDTKNNDKARLSVSLSTVGENYMALKSFDLAMPFLRRSITLSRNDQVNSYSDVYLHNDLSQALLGTHQLDSASWYAYRAIKKSLPSDYKEQRLRSYQYLIDIFKQTSRQDSLNKYYELLIKTKDELFSLDKMRSIENTNFAEQLRQRDIEEEKTKVAEERQQNIQYAFIATGIITFFILFLILSRTIIVNEKWISFLAILALLLVFEFINLLIHPFLEKITHHSPILMLLCLVGLASLLIPLHHKLEHFIKHKLTEKNKAIRLAAAKKTIEQLESE